MRSFANTGLCVCVHQGLAHYLEHMLFMGSTKYPDENEYDSFISASGGSTNAFTECEYTLYHFDVLPQHLEKVSRHSISISGGSWVFCCCCPLPSKCD